METQKLSPEAGQASGGTFENGMLHYNTSPHPYLERKGIDLEDLQEVCHCTVEIRNTAIGNRAVDAVFRELLDIAGKSQGFERILPERIIRDADSKPNDKFAQTGSKVSGTFTPIGFHPSELMSMDCRVIVCAGLADGYRIHQATGEPVACGAGEGNIRSIVKTIQPLNPSILVAVDNDEAGKRAGNASGCKWTHPIIDKDWSDVYQAHGLDAVRDQLAVEVIAKGATLEAMRAIFEKPDPAEAIEQLGSAVTDEARSLADYIHRQLLERLEVDPDTQPEEAESIRPDAERITRMINGAFWSGGKSKVFLLNHAESLNQFSEKDSFRFLVKTFGNVIDEAAVTKLAKLMCFGCEKPEAEEKARAKHISACMGVANSAILDHLKYHNQRESIEWRVDMFAERSRLELLEDKARIVLTHKPYPLMDKPDGYDRIVADYKEHFTRFDEFLEFVTMARFALDRKKAYLWILADSDWGKGFLTGVLKSMGACVETSMKEVEAMLEGKPVGLSPQDFKRASVMLIDEFKTVKSELKQLQSEITLSPKNQLQCSVELFAKVFTSAESVASLVTENGVEDQFANRMSIFNETGNITQRPVFVECEGVYFRAVVAYTGRYLNRAVERVRAMGRTNAEAEAARWLNSFIERYGLGTVYERFSDSLPDLAGQIVDNLSRKVAHDLIVTINGDVYVKSAAKVLDDYLVEHFDYSQIAAFRKKKSELLKMISENGEGNRTHRVGTGKPIKAVKLRRL
jgi:hypothetical protein